MFFYFQKIFIIFLMFVVIRFEELIYLLLFAFVFQQNFPS